MLGALQQFSLLTGAMAVMMWLQSQMQALILETHRMKVGPAGVHKEKGAI